MPSTRQKIDTLIERRALQLREVDRQMERWRLVDARLVTVDQTLTALRDHPDGSVEFRGSPIRDLRARIEKLLEGYSQLAARFARQSVTIGVSGHARVGKATLLWSLTGLDEGQILTGERWPVPAGRIRFDHTMGRPRVLVQFHSEDSFLKEVIGPFHRQLGFPTLPTTLEEFSAWRYPDEKEVEAQSPHLLLLTLIRLLDLRRGLTSYRRDLDGSEREMSFGELETYVAYPYQAGQHPVQKYPAVRGVRIECQFPHEDLGKLSVVDLPWFGEIAPDVGRRLVHGLRDEVDAVLLVKRAAEGMAYWTVQDALALDLLSEVAGPIKRLGDFVYIIVSRFDGDSAEFMAGLEDALRRKLNDGENALFLTAWQVNPRSTHDVGAGMLAPLLVALTERLPAMDRDLLDAASAQADDLVGAARAEIVELERALPGLLRHFTGQADDLVVKTRLMAEEVSANLRRLVQDLEFHTQPP
jgi:hypothetical protein